MNENSRDEEQVRKVLADHLTAVATKDVPLLNQSFTPDAMFYGSDDTEQWSTYSLAQYLAESKNGWDMRECIERSVQLVHRDVMSFFEIIRHVKYGLLRGSGTVVKDLHGDWMIAHYVLSFSVPNNKVEGLLRLLAS